MKETIKKLVAKIPFAKRSYRAIRRRIDASCGKAVGDSNPNKSKLLILKQGAPECFEKMPLRVHWHITKNCNFRCSYCFNAGKEYANVYCTLEQIETAITHLVSSNRSSYHIILTGGEPTVHPHIAEIVNLIHVNMGNRLECLSMTTNGSFDEKFMEAIIVASNQHIIKLNVSIHLEYMGIERIVDLVKRMSNHVVMILHIMFHPELQEKAQMFADTLCRLRKNYAFYIEINMLREPPLFDKIDRRYTREQLRWPKEMTDKFRECASGGVGWTRNVPKTTGWEYMAELIVDDKRETHEKLSPSALEALTGNYFQGMICCAGVNVIHIGVDGKVKGMECRNDNTDCNIFEENPFEKEDWIHGVKCTSPKCTCGINHCIPKFKSTMDVEKFIAEKRREQKRLMDKYKKKNE